LRIEYPGAVYHVTARGNAREPIFFDDEDRQSFLTVLESIVDRFTGFVKLVKDSKDWKWSSYRATAGITPVPKFLFPDWILSHFGSKRKASQAAYRRFVAEGIGKTIWENLKGGVILGNDDFAERLIPFIREKAPSKEVPRVQRFATRPSLRELFAGVKGSKSRRNEKIYEAYMQHGYTLSEVVRELGLHYSTVSKIVHQQKKSQVKI